MESTTSGRRCKVSYKAKLDPNNPPSERAIMLLEKWDKSVFNKIFDLAEEARKERIWHQQKYDLKGKLPKNGWGRPGLVKAADEASGYYSYSFLLYQAEEKLDQIKAEIKGLYALLEWEDHL